MAAKKTTAKRKGARKPRVSKLVAKALQSFERKLSDDDLKLTTAEYLKLLQMEQELTQESPKEITVTWVEPSKTSAEK